ncbi:hypothetical protein GGQ86_003637 [Xanthobacter flavus]|uniref:Uncharacterized protein n=1 Tax=Xanthobacter flavus TaxID=281 RepID=A0A9W6FN53_XANFL|nr:hypothetical protein [Xanthobacter flavus]MBN8915120.1 hypothetical protein [Hyphomicrobiales bacterium]MDR6335147.1 hypothetical protein [Xanthobacter flavus]GLI23628.1 hypothetical protein XFLAVUS301_33020 [Xanthobacter flavus]
MDFKAIRDTRTGAWVFAAFDADRRKRGPRGAVPDAHEAEVLMVNCDMAFANACADFRDDED